MNPRSKPTPMGRKAEQAFQRAVSRVVDENRRLGLPVAVMKNGRAVLIPVREALAIGDKGTGNKGRKR